MLDNTSRNLLTDVSTRPTKRRRLRTWAERISFGYTVLIVVLIVLKPIIEHANGMIGFVMNFVPLFFLLALPIAIVAFLTSRRAALAACVPLVIGGILYGGRFIKSPIEQADRVLRVLTYNISSKSYLMGPIVEFLRQQDPDIISLQEIHLHVNRERDLVNGLADRYPYFILQAVDDGLRANMTLSKYPILSSDELVSMESLYTQICVQGRTLDFYNINLNAPVSSDVPSITGIHLLDEALQYDDTRRDAQVGDLLTRINGQTSALIAAGDFNMSDASGHYDELSAHLDDSFAEAGFGFGFTWPLPTHVDRTSPFGLPPLLRIDYIWHSDALISLHTETLLGSQSDHLAVEADFRWNPASSPDACTMR